VRPTEPAAIAVEDRMYRWVAVLRFLLVANTLVLNIHRGGFSRPTLAAVVLLGLVVWTVVISWLYYHYERRTTFWLVADLAVALAAIAVTPVVKEPGYQSTLPGFWVMGAMFAWAIHWRFYGGLAAAVLLCVDDALARHYFSETVYGNYFLLLIGGPLVGLMVDSLLRSATRTAVAERTAAAATERTRLARVVHDGVLQALSLVQRRAPELGPDGVALGRLAGEQEQALRALIRQQDAITTATAATAPRRGSGETADLVGALSALERRAGVSVAAPPDAVLLAPNAVAEVVAAVAACLDNVAAHVGPEAPAWVLLDASSESVHVTVRDAGQGISEGRLEEAVEEGRLGVVSSIRGRVEDLGGTAEVSTDAYGTVWELTVPR
jgi:signal transduction histidine kinase